MAPALNLLMPAFLLVVVSHLSLGRQKDKLVFNESLARFAFDHAAAAYAMDPRKCLRKYHKPRLVRRGMVPCDYLHNKCWYFIAISNGTIVVAFRGTQTRLQLIVEIVETMSQPKSKFEGGGAVQHYFSTALDAVWPTVLAVLVKLTKVYPSYDILFTGHSLGGALASLASTRFAYERQNVSDVSVASDIILMTFGQPRVGNRKFALVHDQLVPSSFRIVHRYDLVPHLPLCAPRIWSDTCSSLFNHAPYHHGTEIWYPNDMSNYSLYRVCDMPPIDEDRTCSNKHYLHFCFKDHLFYFNEHVSVYGIGGCIPSEVRSQYSMDNEYYFYKLKKEKSYKTEATI